MKSFTALSNTAEATTQAAEEKLADYIVALQGYFRKQEDDFTTYFAKNRKKLSKIKPVNPDKLTGDKKPKNKPLQDFINGYNFRKQEDDLLTILKFIHHNTTPYGIANAVSLINQVAKIKGVKPKKKSFFGRFKYDITDAVTYANSPQFAADAQSYITTNYDDFVVGAKEISKNINSETSALIYDQLYDGIENLESMDDLAVRVGNVYDGCSQSRALTIARTETLRSFNTSTIDSYKVAQINKAQILVAGDETTCSICMGLSGLVMSVDEARSCLPMHPRCRCTWISVVGEPILKEPKLEAVQKIIKDNPKIPVSRFIKVPKVPIISDFSRAMARIEKEIINRKTEKGVVLNNRGRILVEKSGTTSKIEFSHRDRSKMWNQIFVHNHPNGMPFSFADVDFMEYEHLKEIRVIGQEYRYIIKLKNPGIYPNMKRVKIDKIHSMKILKHKWEDKYFANEITNHEANIELGNEIWERVAQHNKELIYIREKI